MNSEIKIYNTHKNIEYPCLMQAKDVELGEVVVLFTAAKKGVIVYDNIYWFGKVGEYKTNFDMTDFILFNDEVTLFN